jgi:hypothetical protein
VGMGFPEEMVMKGIKQIGNTKGNYFHFVCLVCVCTFCSNRGFCFQGIVMKMHCSSCFSHIRYSPCSTTEFII